MNKFWWRNSNTNKGIHWCRWSDLCIPKSKGGLGFRELSKFNLDLLAKQGWKLIMNPNCLFARVMKAKYYPKGDFMSSGLESYPSFTWRSVWGARQLLMEGMGWRIGNVESVNIWNDKWLPRPGIGSIMCQNIDIRYSKVANLINKETNTWKHEVLNTLYGKEQVKAIVSIPLVSSSMPDVPVWRGDNT
ncbi:hypothetical protein J1N35_000692 [Gossypium stocksii]|uniref:Reverse transcriptase zinc-binding domain-containing protein n=1 Tax=Gossypium stocksii TaxID=47602 RepID=A0A9D3WIK7_9ROSI|nr:hypothetical protein J1N35_000692 [Gossypium stocksii]